MRIRIYIFAPKILAAIVGGACFAYFFTLPIADGLYSFVSVGGPSASEFDGFRRWGLAMLLAGSFTFAVGATAGFMIAQLALGKR